nr:immunoglobulin heavy chain junction region [Macaca mulatta]
WAKKEDSLDVW